ncbi:DUF4190 domain-containing protein [Microbacterium sp. 179-I 3D4 NHS]|uniref:DUF4190 domain-containing protein n=1 Tax=Microbacterium sp. 179-I 3D4 NHS TaxID=3142381 RepID=UPI0039A33B45
MSDNSVPPSGDPAYMPPPAPPAPSTLPAQPSQAYPGAAPTYGSPAAAPAYGAPAPQYAPPPAPAPLQPYGGGPVAPGHGYAQPPYPVYPAPRPISGLAIASLVCAIASIVFSWLVLPAFASIAAVITGHMALRRTKENPMIGGRGMAFAGLIIGYVVLGFGVLMLLIGIFSFAMLGAFTLPFVYSS